ILFAFLSPSSFPSPPLSLLFPPFLPHSFPFSFFLLLLPSLPHSFLHSFPVPSLTRVPTCFPFSTREKLRMGLENPTLFPTQGSGWIRAGRSHGLLSANAVTGCSCVPAPPPFGSPVCLPECGCEWKAQALTGAYG